VLLDRARLSLPCRSEGYRPSGVVARTVRRTSSELRVPGVHGLRGEGIDVSDLSAEPMQDGFVIEVERPGRELDRRSLIVYSVLTHPLEARPGIAYARDRLGWYRRRRPTQLQRVIGTSLRKEPQCRCRIRSQTPPTRPRSRCRKSRERCPTSHRRRLRLPTCPLIPTASRRSHRLTSRVAPSLGGRRKARKGPCKCENRGLASRGTSVWLVREPPSGGFSLGLSLAAEALRAVVVARLLGCSGGSRRAQCCPRPDRGLSPRRSVSVALCMVVLMDHSYLTARSTASSTAAVTVVEIVVIHPRPSSRTS
jgi:hypothetical protein